MISIASMIGTGNSKISRSKLIISVFVIARIASGEINRRRKLSSPIHLLPQIPSFALYFLKAICSPNMG